MAFWNLVLMSTAVTAATAAAPSAEIATTAIQEDEVETPTVMSTAVTAATAAAPAAKIVRTATQEDEDEDDDFLPITHLRAANPRTVKNQKQKRRQPQSAAPTTKGYKAIARPSKRNHMESVRIAENRVQGKTKDACNPAVSVFWETRQPWQITISIVFKWVILRVSCHARAVDVIDTMQPRIIEIWGSEPDNEISDISNTSTRSEGSRERVNHPGDPPAGVAGDTSATRVHRDFLQDAPLHHTDYAFRLPLRAGNDAGNSNTSKGASKRRRRRRRRRRRKPVRSRSLGLKWGRPRRMEIGRSAEWNGSSSVELTPNKADSRAVRRAWTWGDHLALVISRGKVLQGSNEEFH